MASKGAKIFIVDIDENKLRKVYGCLFNPASRLDLSWCLCDVSIPEQVEVAIDKCVTKFGKIDAVISYAGIAAYSCIYNEALNLELDLDICKNTMNVNYFGSLIWQNMLQKQWQKNTPNERGERGVICFTSSVCATEGLQMSLPYSAKQSAQLMAWYCQ